MKIQPWFVILGTMGFAIVAGIWWLATGHVAKEIGYWYVVFVGICAADAIEDHLRKRREKLDKIAQEVDGLRAALERIEKRLSER